MSHSNPAHAGEETPKASWSELFSEGRGWFSVLIILATALHALQILVVLIIMPTVVRDIGGADYYAWPSMLYTVGTIIGAAAVAPVLGFFGTRWGNTLSGGIFMVSTVACALSPDIFSLSIARGVQGIAGGLIASGALHLVSSRFTVAQRRRILAAQQGTWMTAQLSGPLIGGLFAQIGWWEGSFWVMVPLTMGFLGLVWFLLADDRSGKPANPFPFFRMMMLASGVFCVALVGPVENLALRLLLIAAATALLVLTFRFDRYARNRLYPSGITSYSSPVGLALWVLFMAGCVQMGVILLLPLWLQVVHGIQPLFISFITITVSMGWTVGTFAVSGWSGARERLALISGPILMMTGVGVMGICAVFSSLWVMTIAAFVYGLGIGVHNVHLYARTMANAEPGEERSVTGGLQSIRSLGTAFGAAVAGVLSSLAGLGVVVEPETVQNAIHYVFGFAMIPLTCAIWFMFRMVSLGMRKPAE